MRALRLALFSTVVLAAACTTQTPVAPSPGDRSNAANSNAGSSSGASDLTTAMVVDQGVAATYAWHAGDAFLAALNPAFSPDVAEAPNGERIRINGTGTLSIHPKSAAGRGTFTHLSSTGAVLGSGTFTVVELLSFVSYGTSPATPPSFNSGKALFRALLFRGGTGSGIPAILRLECTLPGSDVPNGMLEGINLNVPGIANFNQQVSGATVFVKTL